MVMFAFFSRNEEGMAPTKGEMTAKIVTNTETNIISHCQTKSENGGQGEDSTAGKVILYTLLASDLLP